MVKMTILGNLCHDPELREMSGGGKLCKFVLAAESAGKDAEGKRETQFWGVSVFGKRAEACKNYLTKGRKVLVMGEPSVAPYLKKDGTPGAYLNLLGEHIEFVSGRFEDGGMNADMSELSF